MVFDIHSHYIPLEIAENTAFFKKGWSNIDRQLSIMDENHIEKALLLYPTTDAHINMGGWDVVGRIYNNKIAELVKKYEDRFIGAGIIYPLCLSEKDIISEIDNIRGLGLKAISLASSYDGIYLDDERFFPVYEYAAREGMIIHIHPQIINPIGEERVKDPLLTPVLEYMFDVSICIGKMMMSGIFSKFPNVIFIFAHYGGVLPIVKERFDNTYIMLRKREFVKDLYKLPGDYFKNLYFDTSGSKSHSSLTCALEMVGANHILFGSDLPANQDVKGTIDMIISSDFPNEDKELILKKNFVFLLNNT